MLTVVHPVMLSVGTNEATEDEEATRLETAGTSVAEET